MGPKGIAIDWVTGRSWTSVCGSMFSQAIVSWPLQWGPASYAAVIGCGLKRRAREAVGPAGAAVGPGSWAYGCTCN